MTGRHIQAILIGAMVCLTGCSNGAVSSPQSTAAAESPPSAEAPSSSASPVSSPSLSPAPSQQVRKRASMPTHALATRLGRKLQGKDEEDAEAARTVSPTATTTIKDGRLFTPIKSTPNNNPYGVLSSNLVLAQAEGGAPGQAPAEVIEAVDDSALVEAQERHLMNYQVEGAARVLKILPEDLKGRAHQRFLLKLSNGGTILVAHNIDLAPRVPLSPGDVIRLRGEFIWNQKGGVIHYTHHSTSRARQGGWIRFRSLFYQ